MKQVTISFLFLMIFFSNLSAQQKVTDTKIEHVYREYYLYKTKVITEHKVYSILRKTNDPQIVDLTNKADRNNLYKKVGYFAIPLAVCTLAFGEKSISSVYNRNGTTDKRMKDRYQAISGAFFIATIACPTFSLVFNYNYRNQKAEALKLYNEKY